jgi:hypothetical protein
MLDQPDRCSVVCDLSAEAVAEAEARPESSLINLDSRESGNDISLVEPILIL